MPVKSPSIFAAKIFNDKVAYKKILCATRDRESTSRTPGSIRDGAHAGYDKLGADSIARRTRKSRQASREGHAAPVNADERNDAANGDEEDPENQSGSDQEGGDDANNSDDNAAGEMGVEEVGEGASEVEEAVGEVE
ncbi:hypothetical protein PInf_011650 [Phytophthora infestans]|nr:hypothetical protein PInf_011650 [Phytophthora infestans]